MKRNLILLAVLTLFVVTVARVAAAQEARQQIAAGNWSASVHAGEKTTTEQWMIKQDGVNLTGTVKNAQGELPLAGTIQGSVLRAEITEGTAKHKVHIYVTGDQGDGTIEVGKDLHLVTLRRVK